VEPVRTVIVTSGPAGDVGFDPNDPIVGGVVLHRPASPALPFTPHVPEAIGQPFTIQMTPPRLVPSSHMEIDLVYPDSPYGQFVLGESLTNAIAVKEFRSFGNESPGCSSPSPDPEGPMVECHLGNREVVDVGGRTTLLLSGDHGISMHWVEPVAGLSTDVAGEFTDPVLLVNVEAYGMDREHAVALAAQFNDSASGTAGATTSN
jgi:hypothetical protein